MTMRVIMMMMMMMALLRMTDKDILGLKVFTKKTLQYYFFFLSETFIAVR